MENLEMNRLLEVNSNFWQSKRVLVTGHTGFKGGWISLWLQSMGAEVCGVALEPLSGPSLFEVARVMQGLDHHVIDVRDYESIRKNVSNFKPEIIIHMAAQPLVRESYQQPIETFSTNVMGTVHLLEAARAVSSIRAIVNVTTDKCYENRNEVWGYRENEQMGGADPYSSSKACAELVSTAYRKSFFQNTDIAMATARAGNVIGGGDWSKDRLVPDILRALEKNDPIYIRNPSAVRPWQHVLEPLSGYLVLAERLYSGCGLFSEAWNFGPQSSDLKPVSWIVDYLTRAWGRKEPWLMQPGNHPHEANYLSLDISKALHKLSWSPRWELSVALDKTIEWQKAWLDGCDMHNFCLQQIYQYHNHVGIKQ